MDRVCLVLALVFVGMIVIGSRALADQDARPFVGIDMGVSQPTNDNYNAHAHTGATANPYAGYMFNNYAGLQGQLHFTFQPPDNDRRGFNHEDQTTSLFGATAGPRLSLPIGDAIELYTTAQGGVFSGLSGRLTQTAPGFSVGGGVDFYVARNVAISAFGRWNRAYMSPRPTFLGPPVTGPPLQAPEDQGPADIRWATGGIGIKYDFRPPPAPPPPAPVAQAPPPPPPAPAPPVKRKIVLRSVNFDFDKANIRADALPVLDEAVRALQEEGDVDVVVEGHTDSVGEEGYNMKLSHRRAGAVRDFLADHGIAPNRIRTEAYGESRPVASNDSVQGRAQNRRVELRVE